MHQKCNSTINFETKGRSKCHTSDALDHQNGETLIIQEIMTERGPHTRRKSGHWEAPHARRATGVQPQRQREWERARLSTHQSVPLLRLAPRKRKAPSQMGVSPACSLLTHQS